MNDDQPDFDWYAVVQGRDLQQGDFLSCFPIYPPIWVDETATEPQGAIIEVDPGHVHRELFFNVVVMTQSCDFLKLRDEDHVILCPSYDYRTISQERRSLRGRDGWSKLIRGYVIGAHLLNKCSLEGHQFDYQVVDLQRIFSVPYWFVKKIVERAGPRVRLLPPYREHLAQAFARQFMRVGLPTDLPEKYPYKNG